MCVLYVLCVDAKPPHSPAQLECSESRPVIEEAIRECVDEYHSVVASLVKADYTLEESIEAVVKCGTLEAALQHLERAALEEKDSKDLIPMNVEQRYSREPSREDNWYLKCNVSYYVCMYVCRMHVKGISQGPEGHKQATIM